ncbi:MAG: hypothetical protein JSU81_09975 [Candidatus Coatesbacteria bacterium]|nr:MAG: hypothetical protein JSU81_09975 [Candidatus Coatesbacteria bacterium]
MAEDTKAGAAETTTEAPPEPKVLFYVISFIVPIAGIILGALYLSKPDEANREFGKYCLLAAVINFALGFSAVCCVFAFYAMFFVGYLGFLFSLLGIAVGGGAF